MAKHVHTWHVLFCAIIAYDICQTSNIDIVYQEHCTIGIYKCRCMHAQPIACKPAVVDRQVDC